MDFYVRYPYQNCYLLGKSVNSLLQIGVARLFKSCIFTKITRNGT